MEKGGHVAPLCLQMYHCQAWLAPALHVLYHPPSAVTANAHSRLHPYLLHQQGEMDVDANGSVSYAEFKALLAGAAQ